jgi:hypothetical protein
MVSAFEYALLTLMMPLSGTIIELSASATPEEAAPGQRIELQSGRSERSACSWFVLLGWARCRNFAD